MYVLRVRKIVGSIFLPENFISDQLLPFCVKKESYRCQRVWSAKLFKQNAPPNYILKLQATKFVNKSRIRSFLNTNFPKI